MALPGPAGRPDVPAGPYLVAGFARAGSAALRRLLELGVDAHELAAWDRVLRPNFVALYDELTARGVHIAIGGDPVALLDRRPPPRCLLKSPGMTLEHPLPAAAALRGLPVLDEAELAWRLDGRPWVGVTGTNGKSTVCALIAAVLRAAGHRPVVAGNIPAGPALSLAGSEADVVVAELSSFQLESSPALLPELAVLTNLTRDHLDRHGDMASYAAVKRRLFCRPGGVVRRAVVPADGRVGRELAAELRAAGAAVTTFGSARDADVRVIDPAWSPAGTTATVELRGAGELRLRTRSIGPHMAMNAATALAAGRAWGVEVATAAGAIAVTEPVPGRLERVPCSRGFEVMVDFAHNAAGVRAALIAARELLQAGDGRLIATISIVSVFGHAQRRAFARAAAGLADTVVLTTDRWRAEEPADRLPSGLEAGARAARGARVEVVLDRRAAIAHTLGLARPGDLVVIAGRGAMATDQWGADGRSRLFDDRAVARELIELLP